MNLHARQRRKLVKTMMRSEHNRKHLSFDTEKKFHYPRRNAHYTCTVKDKGSVNGTTICQCKWAFPAPGCHQLNLSRHSRRKQALA